MNSNKLSGLNMNLTKCSLKNCLQNEKGFCENTIPNILSTMKPNQVSCIYFDDDRDKSFQEFKSKGGMLAAVNRMRGHRTESELKEAKKAMRKTRSDKGEPKVGGKKRGRPKKEEPNTLEELF